jgi:dTDP-4-dehydrorhamnose 3,5-epimerase
VFSLELSSQQGNMLYVPEGLAHGFYVRSESATFLSLNSGKFSPECDRGIRWDSIPFQWPDQSPVVSDKDRNMVPLEAFDNPF